jgi:hypothetical protein
VGAVADRAAGRVAVVAPGGGYGADGPLLMFSAVAARRRGAMVRRLAWDFPLGGDAPAVVSTAVAAALDEGGYGAALVFGKSLGSLAAPMVAERVLAAVWFTPLLTNPDVVADRDDGGRAVPRRSRLAAQLNGVRGRSWSSPSR